MRILAAILLIISVFMDFSANCSAEESISHEFVKSSQSKEIEPNLIKKSCSEHAGSNHKTETDTQHCHAGHGHVAVKYSIPYIILPVPLITDLEFLDISCSIPSPFLSVTIRPPIFV